MTSGEGVCVAPNVCRGACVGPPVLEEEFKSWKAGGWGIEISKEDFGMVWEDAEFAHGRLEEAIGAGCRQVAFLSIGPAVNIANVSGVPLTAETAKRNVNASCGICRYEFGGNGNDVASKTGGLN